MNKYFAALTALILSLGASAMAAETPHAKVTMTQAKVIALKAAPGTILASELEAEDGGSGLRYSFVIKTRGTKHEVGVDAQTGKILENSLEGTNPD